MHTNSLLVVIKLLVNSIKKFIRYKFITNDLKQQVADFTKEEIIYYDSMGTENTELLRKLREWMAQEHEHKKKKKYDFTSWKLVNMEYVCFI